MHPSSTNSLISNVQPSLNKWSSCNQMRSTLTLKERRASSTVWIVLCMICLLTFTHPDGRAQILVGSITGNVTDTTGAAVRGALVTATDVNTNVAEHATTNKNGVYLLENLQPGIYVVKISAATFASALQSGINLTPNSVRRVNVQMQIGSASSTVTVHASGAALQTDSATVNTVLSSHEITNLPIGAQRNYQSLNVILPGASQNVNQHPGAANPQMALTFHVNGFSWTDNVTLIDGASDIYPFLPETPAYIPPAESISSVTTVTNSFNANEGMAGGAVTNIITRSGTNTLHGALWEYNTDSTFQARPYFFVGRVPKNILNQFGLAVGGPILRNKLFFFADWERTVQRQNASGYLTVPTPALRSGNFAGTGVVIYNPNTGDSSGKGRTPFPDDQIPMPMLNAASLKMLALLPDPNQPGTLANDYFSSATASSLRDNIDVKITYAKSERTSLFGRYSISPDSSFAPQVFGKGGGPALGGFTDGNGFGRIQLVTIGGTHTFSPNLVINGSIGYTRQYLGAEDADIGTNYGLDFLNIPGTNGPDRLQGGFPAFNVSGFTSFGDSDQYSPFLFRDNQYNASFNLDWSLGKHTLQFGGIYYHSQINHYQPDLTIGGPRGGFDFTGGLTSLNGGTSPSLYNAWADFLLGMPHSNGISIQFLNPGAVRESEYGFYAQDQWQALPNLTLNYGVRYELYPYAYGDHHGGILYDPTTNDVLIGGKNGIPSNPGIHTGHGNITPRLGIAYRATKSTVIRAGFGISTNPDTFRNMLNVYPSILGQTNTGLNSFFSAGSLTTGIPPFSGLPNLNAGTLPLPANVGTATYAPHYDRGYIDSYNLTVERSFGAGVSAQVGYVGNRAVRLTCSVALNAAPPGTGAAGQPLYQKFGTTAGITQYTPFCPSNYNALQAQAVRRTSAGTQLGVIYTYSKAMDYVRSAQISFPFQYAPDRYRNYALANFDQTHVLAVYGIYNLPFGRGQSLLNHGVVSVLAGGWKLAGILSRTSGTPFTVTASGASLDAPGNSQVADRVKQHVKILGGHGPNQPYFDPYAFAPVTAPRFGTGSLEDVRGPGYFNLDATLSRSFMLWRRSQLHISAEAIGLTNTPQFANPGANVSDATFADNTITQLNDYDIINSATGNRQLQLGAKLTF